MFISIKNHCSYHDTTNGRLRFSYKKWVSIHAHTFSSFHKGNSNFPLMKRKMLVVWCVEFTDHTFVKIFSILFRIRPKMLSKQTTITMQKKSKDVVSGVHFIKRNAICLPSHNKIWGHQIEWRHRYTLISDSSGSECVYAFFDLSSDALPEEIEGKMEHLKRSCCCCCFCCSRWLYASTHLDEKIDCILLFFFYTYVCLYCLQFSLWWNEIWMKIRALITHTHA